MNAGDRFVQLVAISFAGRDQYGHRRWLFQCDCGTEKELSEAHVVRGLTKSCGCLRKVVTAQRMTKHGQAQRGKVSRTYKIWSGMVARCTIPSATGYGRYGAAGVTVCERWMTFENFRADMGDAPTGMSIDRRENSKGYEPGNCHWADRHTQNNNRRSIRRFTYNGMTMTLTQWARHLSLNKATLIERLGKWTLDRALSAPKVSKSTAATETILREFGE